MPFYKDHCGQYYKANIASALGAVLASSVAIAAVVAFIKPTLLTTVGLASVVTPPVLVASAIFFLAFSGLAWYAVYENNKVSKEKAPKVTQDGLLVRRDVYEKMKENNKNKDKDGKVVEGQSYIDFSLNGKDYRVIVGDKFEELGNTLLFEKYLLEVKGDCGKYAQVTGKDKGEALGLKQSSDEINTYLGELSSVQPAASQERTK